MHGNWESREAIMNRDHSNRGSHNAVLGLLLIIAGTLLLLDRLELLDIRLWQLWPLALIGAGLSGLIDAYENRVGDR